MASEDTKKYYWLKLYSDFFTSKRIKKLRKLAGGDTYTIIYLKMQLLALGTNGYISYEGLENNLAAELALDIDEKEDDVQVVINFLMQYRLMEQIDQSTFLLPFVVECTGSESGKAIRLREARKKQIEHKAKPSLEEIKEYCKERNNSVDAEKFFNYYESNGWKVGKNPMKDWRACVRTWEKNNFQSSKREDIIPIYDTSKNPEFDENKFNRIMRERKNNE